MEDLVLTIPLQDATFIETLAQRMGWTMRKRRTSVERFINSRPPADDRRGDSGGGKCCTLRRMKITIEQIRAYCTVDAVDQDETFSSISRSA